MNPTEPSKDMTQEELLEETVYQGLRHISLAWTDYDRVTNAGLLERVGNDIMTAAYRLVYSELALLEAWGCETHTEDHIAKALSAYKYLSGYQTPIKDACKHISKCADGACKYRMEARASGEAKQ